MEETVKIHGSTWKLSDIRDNVEWSKNQDWEYKKYQNPEKHEHCLICYWTIFETAEQESGYGYFYGGSTWLCSECYQNFIQKP